MALNSNHGGNLKTIACIIALQLLTGALMGENRRVLRPLQPYPILDDAFVATIDQTDMAPMHLQSWVLMDSALPVMRIIDDTASPLGLQVKRKVQFRLFEVQGPVSFDVLEKEIKRLTSIGFRKTTLRHLVEFCNNENAKLFNSGVVFVTSERPLMDSVLPDQNIRYEALFGAVVKEKSIIISILKANDVPRIPECLVILEAPQ